MPDAPRPYRAPRGTIMLGVIAAAIWLMTGDARLPAVRPAHGAVRTRPRLFGGRALRVAHHRGPARAGPAALRADAALKLTGAMLLVLALDGIGYLLAVGSVSTTINARWSRFSRTSSSSSRC